MDPFSQCAIGATAAQAGASPAKVRAATLLGGVAGLAPDTDVFISSPTDTLLFLEFHRQFTHSLIFIPVGAGVVALLLYWPFRRHLTFRECYLYCLLGYATHGLLDACTSYGTQLFWPFSSYRVAWNNVSVVDPLFTLPLVVLLATAAFARRRGLALAGIAWALCYLLIGVVQNQRAEAAGLALAATRGHEPERLAAKAAFASQLLWKVVYQHAGRYYVDAVRTGFDASVCPGSSVAALDIDRDLPWLDANTQQGRDVERFRWFSEDYIALDPKVPNRVIDIRYSMVPNQIDALWGIDVDPDAPANQHARFTTDRRGDAEQLQAYAAMLTGNACAHSRGTQNPTTKDAKEEP